MRDSRNKFQKVWDSNIVIPIGVVISVIVFVVSIVVYVKAIEAKVDINQVKLDNEIGSRQQNYQDMCNRLDKIDQKLETANTLLLKHTGGG